MAVSAAFDDPRFPPLAASELESTRIEISRLTQPEPALPSAVIPGRHGVWVARESQRAVLLPQVATTYGWDRIKLLEEVCLKALLPRDAWQDPETSLLVFEADVFSEDH